MLIAAWCSVVVTQAQSISGEFINWGELGTAVKAPIGIGMLILGLLGAAWLPWTAQHVLCNTLPRNEDASYRVNTEMLVTRVLAIARPIPSVYCLIDTFCIRDYNGYPLWPLRYYSLLPHNLIMYIGLLGVVGYIIAAGQQWMWGRFHAHVVN